ncbi:hypothetical protein SCP_1701240 [Sparassis crispa]|uniref:Uncharacterized protein n=1 Tax=Sparassis crispa TaxID=139825 RepID=A0A401H5Y2_9APHY|nr:hypothetical protein SCP_1701240 [Sparassis crispa]GBE89799.1 hypothetical protein SCP_1701240 [Sparassis crispa]
MPQGPQGPPVTIVPPQPIPMVESTVMRLPPSRTPSIWSRPSEEYSDYEVPRHTPPPDAIHVLALAPVVPTEPRVGSPRQPDAPRTQPLEAPPALPPAPIAPTAPAAHPPIIVQPLPPSISQVVERRLALTRPPRSPMPQREEPSHGEPATIVVRTHSPEWSPCRVSYHRTHRSRSRLPTPGLLVVVQLPSMGPYPGGQLQMPHPVPPSVPVIVQRTRSRTRLPSPIIIHSDRGHSPSIDRDGRRRRPRSPTGVVEGDPHRCSPSPTVLHRRLRPTMRRIFSQMSLEVASHSSVPRVTVPHHSTPW